MERPHTETRKRLEFESGAGVETGEQTLLSSPPGHRTVIALLSVVLLLSGVATFVRSSPGETGVYALAARRLVEGEAIYRPQEGQAFTYPPFFALPYVPFETLPPAVARAGWYALNFLLLGVAVLVVHRGTCVSQPVAAPQLATDASRRKFRLYVLLIGILAGRFLISPIEYQSHDLIVFALVMGAVAQWDSQKTWASGIFAGLATACKATPLLFLPVLAVQRRWSACGAFLATLVAATLLPDVLFPQSSGQLWGDSWYESFVSKVGVGAAAAAQGAWDPWNHLNQGLAGTLYRLFTPVAVPNEHVWDVSLATLTAGRLKVLTTGLQGLIFATVLWMGWRGNDRSSEPRERRMQRLGEAGVVLTAMLLLSPMSSKQHFCTLLVPVAFCAADLVTRRRSTSVCVAFAVVLLFGTLSVKDLIGRPWGNYFLAVGSLTWCAVAMLLASMSVLVQRRRAEQSRQGSSSDGSMANPESESSENRVACTAA